MTTKIEVPRIQTLLALVTRSLSSASCLELTGGLTGRGGHREYNIDGAFVACDANLHRKARLAYNDVDNT